ncbi:MAG TPA: response regulator [Streptosporangiaceae bacterium]|nr:response regulator [Streptosporangiaceae bacterium]
MQAVTGGAGRPLRILIVDDHEVSRAALCALLRTEGYEVAEVGRDFDPVAAAIEFRPVAVVVDVAPGEAAGFDLARQFGALTDPGIVVLTSSADRREFGSRLAGQVFIAKADLCGAAILDGLAGRLSP